MILEKGVRVKTCSGIEGIVVGRFCKNNGPVTGWYYHVKDINDGSVIPFHQHLITDVVSYEGEV